MGLFDTIYDWAKRNIRTCVLCIGMLIAALFMMLCNAILAGGYQTELNRVTDEMHDAQTVIEQMHAEQQSVLQEKHTYVGGLDTERVSADKERIDAFLRQAFTWDGFDAYMSVYDMLTGTWPVSDNPDFYGVFVVNPDAVGSEYADANMEYAGIVNDELFVTKISGTTYTYFMEVDFTSSYGDVAASGRFAFGCTVDENGVLSELYATRIS